ncbi:hypothetical protein H8D85_01580 [bacterium]|nr:hypothetical protein [bacterium]
MYYLVETNGSQRQKEIADYITNFLENFYGCTIDYSVGLMDSPVSVYNDNNDLVASFDSKPDEAVLAFHFGLLGEEQYV